MMSTRRRLTLLLLAIGTIALVMMFLGIALFSDFSGQHRINPGAVGGAVAVAIAGMLLIARVTRAR